MKKDWSVVVINKEKTVAKIQIKQGSNLLSFREVFNYWESNPDFIDFYAKEIIAKKSKTPQAVYVYLAIAFFSNQQFVL